MQSDKAVIERWTNAAPYWEKYRDTIREMFAPVTQALIEDAQIGEGNDVLDVASGSGEPALSIAALVGPHGSVVGVDPVPGMVAAAAGGAEARGLANARFEVASAHELPFADAIFDAAVSRFGVMFFPSPVEGVREMLRVLKPGRKLAFAAWSEPEANPLFYSTGRIVEAYLNSPPVDPDAPEAFRFGPPGKLRDVLREAGASAVSERVFPFRIEAEMSVEDFWAMRRGTSEKLRNSLAVLSSEQFSEVERRSIEALREYSSDGRMSFGAQVLIVSGNR